jgi:hypothetical protein
MADRPDLVAESIARTRRQTNENIPDCLIVGYENGVRKRGQAPF